MTPRRVALAVALLALAVGATALGFVRSRTSKSNVAIAWHGSCAFLIPDSAGTPDVDFASVTTAIEASAAAWNDAGCSYFKLDIDPPAAGGAAVLTKPVAENFVLFRSDTWCPPDSTEACYDANATALTTVFYVDKPGDASDGQIIEAVVEVNNVDFAFTVTGSAPATAHGRPVADIQNTLTHEFGHVLGLDHTCYDGWNPCQNASGQTCKSSDTGCACKVNRLACTTELDCYPTDNTGQHIPSCGAANLPASVTDATMYNFAAAGDTSKRTLSQDDIDGVCAIYPLASDPKHCARVDTASSGGGCAVARGAGPPGGLALLGLLGLGGLARRRRRT
jgi:MYXO-CTERM domain-containing protein